MNKHVEEPTQINWRAPADLVKKIDSRAKDIFAMTGIKVTRQQLVEAAIRDTYSKAGGGA